MPENTQMVEMHGECRNTAIWRRPETKIHLRFFLVPIWPVGEKNKGWWLQSRWNTKDNLSMMNLSRMYFFLAWYVDFDFLIPIWPKTACECIVIKCLWTIDVCDICLKCAAWSCPYLAASRRDIEVRLAFQPSYVDIC